MGIKSYKELLIWQKGIEIVRQTYSLTNAIPSTENFGVISQLRRSAISIPSNIAEGWGRETPKSFIQYTKIAKGSLMELETLLFICNDLKYIKNDQYQAIQILVSEELRMIQGFINKLKKDLTNN